MTTTVDTPEANANTALAHFFIGLMKADGIVTSAEERKVEILINKFRRGMPGNPDEVMPQIRQVLKDHVYDKWMPMDHLEGGFKSFDKFVESGQAEEEHMESIIQMLEILMEVDGITQNEILYMDRIRSEFLNRYAEAKV